MCAVRRNIYSVSQINGYVKRMFAEDFLLGNVYVRGEVSNCKYHSSGHVYFTIKDKDAVLSAVMFAGNRNGLNFRLSDGQNVIVGGSVNIYERDGKYQLYAREIETDGEGDLYVRYERLKKELSDMGMFDASYKKPIPKYALNIGVVTAAGGAAIRDIINISERRNPHVRIYLYSAKVQGEGAAQSVASGIRYLDNTIKPDVIIVGRGGGSIEDLWAFNEEIVARAIFECDTPVISAVGHETDVTISDYVADLRAPTPSAAAELAIFDHYKFLSDIGDIKYKLNRRINDIYESRKMHLSNLELRVKGRSPENIIRSRQQRLDSICSRMRYLLTGHYAAAGREFAIKCERLNGLSPLKRISRGYGYVSSSRGAVTSVNDVKEGDNIDITIRDGRINAEIKSIERKKP